MANTRNLYGSLVNDRAIMVHIPRQDIDTLDVEPALAALNRLVASREALEASNGTLALYVQGYDDDPRELHAIPEVRAYFQALDEGFPYWFHVCLRVDFTLRLLFTMLVELEPVALDDPPGAIGYRFANDDLNDFVRQRLLAMRALHASVGFDPQESERIAELVLNYFTTLAGAER